MTSIGEVATEVQWQRERRNNNIELEPSTLADDSPNKTNIADEVEPSILDKLHITEPRDQIK